MFKTEIEFMDGVIREYPSRHLARADKEVGVYRMIFDHEEVIFPLCNIRRVRTITVKEPEDMTGALIKKYYEKEALKKFGGEGIKNV